MPSLTITEIGISSLSALSIVSTTTLSTVIFRMLHLTYVSLLGLRSDSSMCCTSLGIRSSELNIVGVHKSTI